MCTALGAPDAPGLAVWRCHFAHLTNSKSWRRLFRLSAGASNYLNWMAPPLPISKPPPGPVSNAASVQGQRRVAADQSARLAEPPGLAERPGLINAHRVSQNLSKNANAVRMRMLASVGHELIVMQQRDMTNRNAHQSQPEAANQPPAKAPPHPPRNCSANGQNLTAVRTLVTALQRRRGRGHKAASRTRPDKNTNTDQPEKLATKLATKLAINLSIKLAGRSSATAMAAPAIMRAGDRKSPGRSHGFTVPLVMGNPVAGAQNQVLNQARVARGG